MQTLTDLVGPVPQILAEADAFIADHPVISAIIGVTAVALLILGYFTARSAFRVGKRFPPLLSLLASRIPARPAEDVLTVISASIATGVSAQGMWRFSGDVLGFDGPLRLLLFAFIEVAVITSAVRARRNMRENYSAGIDGMAVWVLTCLTAVLSSMDAGSLPEAVFRLAAPLVAAWLWERGMAIERHRITGRKRINWRLTPERMLVRAGLAEASDRTASEVDRQRRFTRVALAAKKVRVLREVGAKTGKVAAAQKHLERAYADAHAHTGLGRDEALQETLAAEVRSLYSAGELVALDAASAWTKPAKPSDLAVLVAATKQMSDGVAIRSEIKTALQKMRSTMQEMRAMESNVTMLATDVTRGVTPPAITGKVTAGVTKKVTEPPVFVPQEWTSQRAAVTPPATPAATSVAVAEQVTFDVTNPAAYDITQSLLGAPSVTEFATPAVTSPAITGKVTKKLTFESKPARQPKTAIMRAYWDKVRQEEKRYPEVVEIAKAADAHHSLASRLRAEWVKELPYWEQRKANPKPKRPAVSGSINGHAPTGGAS